MNPGHLLSGLALGLWLLLSLSRSIPARAEESSSQVIDRSNWHEVQGLLPEPVLKWVEKGDAVLDVSQLHFHPADFLPPACKESVALNDGKYDVDADGVLTEKQSGKPPALLLGYPFPKIDESRPEAGLKLMYNMIYYTYACGNVLAHSDAVWVGRQTGHEREINFEFFQFPLDGWSGAKEEPNPENIESYSIIRIVAPFDIAGTNVLTWRYRDKRLDNTFTYIPAIRRVRRMSPANRSDAFVGSDFTVDDAWLYSGKVNAFEWKILKKTDQLLPFMSSDPQPLVRNAEGEYETTRTAKVPLLGYQKAGWTGAPWFPTNLVWQKRPAYILECRAKDRYYNYGIQYLWIDAETFQPNFKVIHDRSGGYWKVVWQPLAAWEETNTQVRLLNPACMVSTDDRNDHSTVLMFASRKNVHRYFAIMDRNNFSLSGFEKLCK
ncbi:MAG: outer membrane lipoprotein-sorting protein [bacterium]